ncbi:hypothetical protein BHU72_11840 [Desulfuribacillus stibiiarsenatis]|uniref:Uncharacterized protein n=1 Tax=Desulfuribacillus stibiiarsenatis TaxID=1390249 RepID=A0A1E5L7U3_9FIRM|nr:hypothetical protein BHU72_11840 [Desulfuribacillus stibiiarsenatis]
MNYKNVKGFIKLTREQQQVLISTHTKHQSILGMDQKYGYTPVEVKAASKLNSSVIVKFQNGEWMHYTASGDWY